MQCRADREAAVVAGGFDKDVVERSLAPNPTVAWAVQRGPAGEAEIAGLNIVVRKHPGERANRRQVGFFEEQLCRRCDIAVDRLCRVRSIPKWRHVISRLLRALTAMREPCAHRIGLETRFNVVGIANEGSFEKPRLAVRGQAHQFSGVPDTNQTGGVIVHRAENEVVRRDGPETRAVAKCKKPPMISVPGRKTVMGHDGRPIESRPIENRSRVGHMMRDETARNLPTAPLDRDR